MNERIIDDLREAIRQTLNRHCDDPDRWPDFTPSRELEQSMARAAAVVFDAYVRASQHTREVVEAETDEIVEAIDKEQPA